MKVRRALTTRKVTNEDGETVVRPVLAVRDENRYRPQPKGTAIGPPKPGRNTGQGS